MKKYKSEQVTKVEQIHESTVCNKCGHEIKTDLSISSFEVNLIHNFNIGFGYGSEFDMESWKFDLCENCLLEFVRTFKHMPEGFAWESNHPENVFDEWKNTKKLNWKAGWTQEDINEDNKRREKYDKRMKDVKDLIYKFKKEK